MEMTNNIKKTCFQNIPQKQENFKIQNQSGYLVKNNSINHELISRSASNSIKSACLAQIAMAGKKTSKALYVLCASLT